VKAGVLAPGGGSALPHLTGQVEGASSDDEKK
jgi:hypothetical protein